MNYRNYARIIASVLVLLALLLAACRGGGAPLQGWSGPTVDGSVLYLGTLKGKVVAYDSSNGDPRWQAGIETSPAAALGPGCSAPPSSGAAFYGNLAAEGDAVFVGTYQGNFYALNASNGAVKWQYPKTGRIGAIVGGPVVHQGVVYGGSSDGKVYALNAVSGMEKWTFTAGNKIWSTPIIANDTLYFGCFDGNLYALNPATGTLIWKFATGGAIAATPLIVGDTIYVGSFDRQLYAIDARTGSTRWSFQGEGWFWDAPATYGNILIAGNLDHKVYAVDATTHKLVWQYETNGAIRPRPVIVGETVVIASEDKNLYFLKAGTGNLIRTIPLGTPLMAPLAAQKGLVYVHTQQGLVIAFNAETGTRVWEVSTV